MQERRYHWRFLNWHRAGGQDDPADDTMSHGCADMVAGRGPITMRATMTKTRPRGRRKKNEESEHKWIRLRVEKLPDFLQNLNF